MLIHLHKQATTTPKVRAKIQASREPASVLAERFGTMEQTIYGYFAICVGKLFSGHWTIALDVVV